MLPILRINIIHLFRLYIPNNILRYTISLFVILLLLGGFAMGFVFGLHPPPQWQGGFRSKTFVSNLSALLGLINNSILIVPTFLTIRGCLKLMENPRITELVMLAPISPVAKFWAALGPVIIFSAIPFLLVTGPFVITFLFLDPLISFSLIMYFILLSGWCVTFSVLSLVVLVHASGRTRALRIAYLIPIIPLIIPALISYGAENFRKTAPMIGYWQLIVLSVSLIILPLAFNYASKMFFVLINVKVEKANIANAPIWGKYRPWTYVFRRSVHLAMLPVLVILLCLLSKVITFEPFNQALFAVTLYVLATMPLNVIMAQEQLTPERWQLAPLASTLRRQIWLQVNLPMLLLSLLLLGFMGGNEHWIWAGSVILVIITGMLALTSQVLLRKTNLQPIIYFLLIVAATICQLLW